MKGNALRSVCVYCQHCSSPFIQSHTPLFPLCSRVHFVCSAEGFTQLVIIIEWKCQSESMANRLLNWTLTLLCSTSILFSFFFFLTHFLDWSVLIDPQQLTNAFQNGQFLHEFLFSSAADWHDEMVSWLLETALEKWGNIPQVTDAAGCSLRWNESTLYVRVIAVFKTPLTLCVYPSVVLLARQGRERQEEGGEEWLVVIYKHCALWLPFSQAETQVEAGYMQLFFSTPAFSLRFSSMNTHLKPTSTPPFFSPSQKHTHTQMHAYTHTQALLGYWTAIAVRSPL